MTSRERFEAILNFQPFDRLPIIECAGWWNRTIERWKSEGLPDNIQSQREITQYFGLDESVWGSLYGCGPDCPKASHYSEGLIKNLSEYKTLRDQLYVSPNLSNLEEPMRAQQNSDCLLWFGIDGFFWFPRILLGVERHLYSFYDQPELTHLINSAL